jgi:sugar phosphate isomerase/epimerase
MPSTDRLPLLGAAVDVNSLAPHRAWILEKQRDLELQDFCSAEALDGDWRETAAELRRMLDGYTGRLGIHGPFRGFPIDSPDPLIRQVVNKRFLQGLDVCEALGATQMVIHSPFTTRGFNNLDIDPGARAELAERAHLTLDEVVRRAGIIGVELVIENVEDKDPEARVALAASFGNANVHVSLDTGHAHCAHVSTGAPPVDCYVTAAGDALTHVHIQDTDGYADRHWRPGKGAVNWHAVFRALEQLSTRPRLIIELRDKAHVREGADHLVSLGLAA